MMTKKNTFKINQQRSNMQTQLSLYHHIKLPRRHQTDHQTTINIIWQGRSLLISPSQYLAHTKNTLRKLIFIPFLCQLTLILVGHRIYTVRVISTCHFGNVSIQKKTKKNEKPKIVTPGCLFSDYYAESVVSFAFFPRRHLLDATKTTTTWTTRSTTHTTLHCS